MLKFKVDEVQIQGKEYERAIVDHPGSVAVVPFIDRSRILMIRQYRYPVRKTILEIPAGTLEKDEKPQSCARRELEEETGYTPGNLRRIASLYLAPGYSSELIHIFVASSLRYKGQNTEKDEKIKVEIKNIHDVVRAFIEKRYRCDAKTVCGLYFAIEYLKKRRLSQP